MSERVHVPDGDRSVTLSFEKTIDQWIGIAASVAFTSELSIAKMQATGKPMPESVAFLVTLADTFRHEILDQLPKDQQ
jgi:hypothetical protein